MDKKVQVSNSPSGNRVFSRTMGGLLMKDKILWIILIAIIAGAGVAIFSLAGCSYKPIWIKELPAVCNMSLNTYRLQYKSKDKSGTVPGTLYCFKKLHRLDCRGQHFGVDKNGKPNVVDYENFVPYKAYNSCLKELD